MLLPTHRLLQTELGTDNFLVTGRERSLVDSLLYLDYSGGHEAPDKSLATFPSFDFDAALHYLKLFCSPRLYSLVGFPLVRDAEKLFFRTELGDGFMHELPRSVLYLAN